MGTKHRSDKELRMFEGLNPRAHI